MVIRLIKHELSHKANCISHSQFMRLLRFIFVAAGIFLFAGIELSGQVAGDYRSAAAGSWNNAANWDRYNGGAWVNNPAEGYPGQNGGTNTVTIQGGRTMTIDASIPNAIGVLVFTGEGATNLVSISGAYTLSVSGTIAINPPTGGTNNNG
jgi:hypothetical protein